MKGSFVFRFSMCIATLIGICFCGQQPADAQGIASIQNFTSRPFVTGVRPVIGSNGAVGGIKVDAAGVVSRNERKDEPSLRQKWIRAANPLAGDIAASTDMRMISLSRLDQAIDKLVRDGKHPSEEMFFLAGLQRVEYVFAVPERNDVVLAGPAGGWQMNALGEVVGKKSGEPVLRLDDLIVAMRTARATRETPVSCSIEPTAEGQRRYALVQSRRLALNKRVVEMMEKSLGQQQVLLTGVPPDSHMSRVLVASDYMMKRLAMGFEASPVDDMPNYLDMLKSNSDATKVTSPRWWMATNYQPLMHSPDRLAWQIQGQGVKTLTEDSVLNARGERTTFQANALAQKWADTMTANFNELRREIPIFGQLRNCVDLNVVAALMSSEGLLTVADCELNVLMDEARLGWDRFPVPKSVPSRASLVKSKNGWIVSVSGGVDIDSWNVIERTEESAVLTRIRTESTKTDHDRWWW